MSAEIESFETFNKLQRDVVHGSEQAKDDKPHVEQPVAENDDPRAVAYLDHLLNDGALEGDSGAEMELPSWYNERLFAHTKVATVIEVQRDVVHGSEQAKDDKPHVEQPVAENDDPRAVAYLDHLLNDGALEGDSGAEMELPSWYNERLFAQGQTYMSKYRFVVTAGMLSGLVAVLAIPSILRILICTRQSSTPATAYRRYVRTIFHTKAWYDYSPTSKSSRFWTSLRAVRKAHARSSRACAKMAAGQITQKDLALTQFGFIGLLTLGAGRIQLYDDEFLESTSHMWRVLGYLLGMKDEYNICGTNWAETKLRLDIVMRRVYEPALEKTSEDFATMTKAMLEGLWPVSTSLTVGSFLFFTKRLTYVKGYEYYDFDYPSGRLPNPNQKKYYYDLSWWDRLLVSYGLFMVTYMHKYDIMRWFLNFEVWLSTLMMHYLPYLAIWKYGIKGAYVRIFTGAGNEETFEFHLKED